MTENNKPEWFEITENDGPAVPPKASKTLPLAAVFATALILGVGAVVGQVQEESTATAVGAVSAQSAITNTTTTSAPVARVAESSLQNPSIAQLPTKSEDDDDHEGRSHKGDHDDDDDDDDEDEGDDD